jgi:hypothetical protein
LPFGEVNFSAPLTTNSGMWCFSARRSISSRAIFARPGTTGSGLKLDSCSMTASVAHRFGVTGRNSSDSKAV